MTKKKIMFPKLDISVVAALTDELDRAENELLDTDTRKHIDGVRRLHSVINKIRDNIKMRMDAYERDTKRELPNKPDWHKGRIT